MKLKNKTFFLLSLAFPVNYIFYTNLYLSNNDNKKLKNYSSRSNIELNKLTYHDYN